MMPTGAIGVIVLTLIIGSVFFLITRWAGRVDRLSGVHSSDVDNRPESDKHIDRLHAAAWLFRCAFVFALGVLIFAAIFLLFPSRGSSVTISGQQVTGIGGLMELASAGAIMLLALWSASLLLDGAALGLEHQIIQQKRLEDQDKMVKSIGRMLQQLQRDKLEDTPVTLSRIPRKD